MSGDKDKTIRELQKKLKVIEASYKEMETLVKDLQEEKETLKIDVKDLTEYIKKKDSHDNEKETEVKKAKVCKFLWKDKGLTKHSQSNEKENIENDMYNCEICDFQATKSAILSTHMNIKHRTTQEQTNDVFKCTECQLQFSEKWNLMNHKKNNHEVTEICEHFVKDKCSFSAKTCWNLHQKPNSKHSSTEKNIIVRY